MSDNDETPVCACLICTEDCYEIPMPDSVLCDECTRGIHYTA